MDEIIPGLWVGDLPSATDTASLKANKIFSILSAMRGRVTIHETFIRHQISLDDTEETDVLVHFIPAITFIQAELDKGRGVLVHCQAGMSRSVTIVAAYLMYTQNIDTEAALDLIRKARPNIDPNPGFLLQLEIFHKAAFKISRRDKTTRMFYMERAVEEVMNGDGSLPETTMFAKYPRTPSDSQPGTPGGPRRRIRCKLCRQELATREHMLDHGQLGAPTPASLTPVASRHPSMSMASRPRVLSSGTSTRPRRPSGLGEAMQMSALDTEDEPEPEVAANGNGVAEGTPKARRTASDPSRRPRLRPLVSGVADLTMSQLAVSTSSSALDTEDDSGGEDDEANAKAFLSATRLGRRLSDAVLASPTSPTSPIDSSAEPTHFTSSDDLAAQLRANPKLAALRGTSLMSPLTPILGSSKGFAASQPIIINPKCSGYFVEPMKWMEPFLEEGQIAGKIVCPNTKCGAKLGNYDWAGMCCGCKEWVTPGFLDTTGKPSAPKRAPRRPPNEEEQQDIDLKRLRGELSCAECRRLKLKCDKCPVARASVEDAIPYVPAVRQLNCVWFIAACAQRKDLGILSAGQGTRFILADTDQLHAQIAAMSQRIRQLEEALAILQGAVSSERHPLLAQDLLSIKFGMEASKRAEETVVKTEPDIDGMGTLALRDDGAVKYFGRSGGTETLMVAEAGTDFDDDLEEDEVIEDDEIADMGAVFPIGGRPDATKLSRLRALLPPLQRARELAESWLLHGALFFRPIKREELLGSFLQSIYQDENAEPHTLAMSFFIFALATLLDVKLPPYNTAAETFYGAGRAALGLQAVYDTPSVDTVRAIGLMATYHSLGGRKYTRDSAWCLMSIAAKLAQSIGLHRDCARWHMEPNTVQMRRTLFWDIFCADVSHSLALGRPPAIPLSYVDCEYPVDEESTLTDLGETLPGFWRHKYVFSRDIWLGVAEHMLATTTPDYEAVLELDRRVRQLSVPDSFKPYPSRADGEAEYHSPSASLRGFYSSQYRTVTMMHIHRSFFAQALLDFPANPLRSPFATSFLTAYRSASVLIKATAYQFDRNAEMAIRVWFLLQQAFSAAVVVGTVVTLSPKSSLATSALTDLALAIQLFERASAQSHQARIATGILSKLRDRAVRAYTQSSPDLNPAGMSPAASSSSDSPGRQSSEDVIPPATNELEIFGGQKRMLSLKQKQKHRRGKSATAEGTTSAAGTPMSSGFPSPPSVTPVPMEQSPFVAAALPYMEAQRSTSSDDFPWLDDFLATQPPPNVPSFDLDLRALGGPSIWVRPGDIAESRDPRNLQFPRSDSAVGFNPTSWPSLPMQSQLQPTLNDAVPSAGGGGGPGAGAMVELGLTGESGMDAAWLAFMQQCGVSAEAF
ncbi:hypothetical protein HMN09_00217000 [Mycena chlorophos]|uniref:protein-tyrosine-phosphatase n=1 Tax=Mycena chlorophos TaxID=658473 RepID=A0A8H6TLE1_MYCCL|nr:hypothetical protein HMN09_00217000 [Mycena chlorophos]